MFVYRAYRGGQLVSALKVRSSRCRMAQSRSSVWQLARCSIEPCAVHVKKAAWLKDRADARLNELMPLSHRPNPASPTPMTPDQLRVGARFTDSDGEWEVATKPQKFRGGKIVEVIVQHPGQSSTAKVMSWPAYERISVRRPTKNDPCV